MSWFYFLVFGMNKHDQWNKECFFQQELWLGKLVNYPAHPDVSLCKIHYQRYHLWYRGSRVSVLRWRHSSPLHPVRCLNRRHSCHMSAFQCASEPAEECEAIFMRLNTVSWLKRFEFWLGQTGFLWAVPVRRRQFWKYYPKLCQDHSLQHSLSLSLSAAQSAITMATLSEQQINKHVYKVNVSKIIKTVCVIYVGFLPNKLHVFCRVIWQTLFRSW
jgi:hypothetical protein